MDADYISNMLKYPNRDTILKYELDLLEALNFNINLYHPYRSLFGFVAHMQVRSIFFQSNRLGIAVSEFK